MSISVKNEMTPDDDALVAAPGVAKRQARLGDFRVSDGLIRDGANILSLV